MQSPEQGYAIEAVKIPLSGSVAGFAGDIGAVLTRQDILTNLQCGPSRRVGQGPREEIDEHSKKRSGPEEWRPDPCSFRRHGRRSPAPDARKPGSVGAGNRRRRAGRYPDPG